MVRWSCSPAYPRHSQSPKSTVPGIRRQFLHKLLLGSVMFHGNVGNILDHGSSELAIQNWEKCEILSPWKVRGFFSFPGTWFCVKILVYRNWPSSSCWVSTGSNYLDLNSILGVSKNRGTPKWMVYDGKAYKIWWFGGTIIFGNTPIAPRLLFSTYHYHWGVSSPSSMFFHLAQDLEGL